MKTFIIILGLVFMVSLGYSQKSNVMEGKYYFKTTVKGDIEKVKDKTEEIFKIKGFGLITEIPMHKKLEEKLDNVDMHPYYIMGFCDPAYAYKTLQLEEYIGLYLPCKVVVKDNGDGSVDVVAIDPQKAMESIGNEELAPLAGEVTELFKQVIAEMPEEV